MFARWNERGTKIIDLTRTMRDAEGKMAVDPELVKIKTRRNTILLGPGINEISEDEFTLAKPHIQRELRAKTIQVVRLAVSARKTKDGETAQKITDLSTDDAIKLVNACGKSSDGQKFVSNYGNRDTLYRWLAEETRENVNDAVYARLRGLGFLSEQDALSRKPVQQDLAVARALVAEESAPGDVAEEDYVEDADSVLTEV
jgi:hypothetical protein